VLRGGDRVAGGGVDDRDPGPGGSLEIDVVDPDPGPTDDDQAAPRPRNSVVSSTKQSRLPSGSLTKAA